jgi:uncharacterized protein (DUF1697 family)
VPKYVAFLRAINVGGHAVKMDHLRRLFESVGFESVETFIASGNVIFDWKSKNTLSLQRKIEKVLGEALGYQVATFVRSTSEMAAIAGYQPFKGFKNKENHSLFIGFMAEEPGDDKIRQLLSFNTKADLFDVKGREIYWLRYGNFSDSKFYGGFLEKILGTPLTIRNANTVKKIAARYC